MAGARQAAGGGTPGDATARFLRELRQLRDYAGLGQAELAARAHYPHDYIRAAEVGPAPPDLPLLSAYVRGCGGTVEEWEERWRSLTNTPALPLLSTRSGGGSTAATAGARIGSVSPVADVPDPAAIVAALNRVAEKIAASTLPAPTSPRSTPPTSTQSPVSAFSAVAQPPAAASARQDLGTAPRAAKPTSVASASGAAAPGVTASGAAAPGALASGTAASGAAASGALASDGLAAAAAAAASAAGGRTAGSTGTSAGAPAAGTVGKAPGAAAAKPAVRGRPFSMASRTTIAALIALAICVLVAVLAVFA